MQELLSHFRSQRRETRLNLQRQMNPSILVEKLRGQDKLGKREDGAHVRTKESRDLSLFVNGTLVSFSIGIADRSYLSGFSPLDADSIVREGAHKRSMIPIFTDLFHAVRLFKHMKEGYRKELAGTKTVLKLEELNASLACMNAESEAQEAISNLQEKMQRKSSATKLVAFAKMEHARKLLEKSIVDKSHKEILVGAACACLVAARNRYENWRTKEVLRSGSHAYLRECSLRAERDEFIRKTLQELIWLCDNSGAIARISMWAEDERVINILKNVSVSNLEETIKQLDSLRWGKKYAVNARGFLEKGEKEKAMLELRKLLFYLSANKPHYIAEQVEKTGDAYLCEAGDSFLDDLRQGEELFKQGKFSRSKSHFEVALMFINQTN